MSDMRLKLARLVSNQKNTLSLLFVDSDFFAFVPEDEWHEFKVAGHTRIPCGIYDIEYTWSDKFTRFTYELKGVNGYTGIRIHSGVNANDTEGCVMPGKNVAETQRGWWETSGSRVAVQELEQKMDVVRLAGGKIRIKVTDEILEDADLDW
jgi:hypothetical protein